MLHIIPSFPGNGNVSSLIESNTWNPLNRVLDIHVRCVNNILTSVVKKCKDVLDEALCSHMYGSWQ